LIKTYVKDFSAGSITRFYEVNIPYSTKNKPLLQRL